LIGGLSIAQVNLPVGFSMGHDYSNVGEGGLWRVGANTPPRKGHRRDALRQLVGQTVIEGALRLDLHPPSFAPFLPADQLDSYIAGLILLAAAPCTAMVLCRAA
jgi:hypothetical protein